MQDDHRHVEELHVLLGDRLLEIAHDSLELEGERLGHEPEDRDADLDRTSYSQVLHALVALVLDEASQLADLGERQVGQDRQPIEDAPAVDLLRRQERSVLVAQSHARGGLQRRFDDGVTENLAGGRRAGHDVDVVGLDRVERLVLQPPVVDHLSVDEVDVEVLRETEPHQGQELLLSEAGRLERDDADSVPVGHVEERIRVRPAEDVRQPDLRRAGDQLRDVRVGLRVREPDPGSFLLSPSDQPHGSGAPKVERF